MQICLIKKLMSEKLFYKVIHNKISEHILCSYSMSMIKTFHGIKVVESGVTW